ncbi:MAG: glycosyltransferase family 2 protein [Oscillospiraceae bacterium]
MSDTLYVVVPCYNEEEVLPETSFRLKNKLDSLEQRGKISSKSRILFVDDGSKDNTWKLIEGLHKDDPDHFSGLKLSRNKGHQNALMAGLMEAKSRADMVVSMDADLQDDIGVIDGFVDKYHQGCDVVYGVRSDRKRDSGFKRFTAQSFYKIMGLLGVNLVYNHADCRLMSRRALEGLAEFKEVNLFLRGIVPLVGYKSDMVEYSRGERFAGESKYPLRKMLAFAWDGVTSFSVKPIRFITVLGFIVLLISLGLMIYTFVRNLTGNTVPGWSTLMGSIWLLGGLQIFSLGIVGEYVGKIYQEAKGRPKYIIETLLDKEEDQTE